MRAHPILIVAFTLVAGLILDACTSSPAAVEKTIFVAPQMVDCPSTDSQQCLQVKENAGDGYIPTFESIAGFEFVPGYEYRLRVVKESTAGSPGNQWRLVEVVSKTPVSSPLKDTQWYLSSYINAQGHLTDVLPETQVTLEFTDGKLSGNAGCNSYFGDYRSDKNSLNIGSIASTEMYCTSPEGVMEQESNYLGALVNATSYMIAGDQLTLTNVNGETIVTFSVLHPVGLTQEAWQMVAISNAQGELVPALAGASVTAEFSQDGTLSGSAGCNLYGTPYVVDGQSITISKPAATRMYCAEPEGIMEQESAYLKALESALNFLLKHGTLELYDASGALTVRFQIYESSILLNQSDLAGTSWTWRVYQSSADEVIAPPNPDQYSLTFKEDGLVEIQTDCHFIRGTYRTEGTHIVILPDNPESGLCVPDSLSDRFLQLIGDSNTYLFTENGELAISILYDSGILFFEPVE